MIEFNKWPKIPRYENETFTITEKIDGTNAQFYITEDNEILTGSRNRWVTVEDDNYGFASWIQERKEYILCIFPRNTRFYGEFYGQGINRGYGLDDRRLALFNSPTSYLCDGIHPISNFFVKVSSGPRTISEFPINDLEYYTQECIKSLDHEGSTTVPGYMNPEGIIVQLSKSGQRYKVYCRRNADK